MDDCGLIIIDLQDDWASAKRILICCSVPILFKDVDIRHRWLKCIDVFVWYGWRKSSWWLFLGLLYCRRLCQGWLTSWGARGNWPADDCAQENLPVDDWCGWLCLGQQTCRWLWYCVQNDAWDDWPVDDRHCSRLCLGWLTSKRLCQEWLTSGWFDDLPVNGCAMR